MSKHLFKFNQQSPQEKTAAGLRIKANKTNFPTLKNVSLYKILLQAKGVREPHWHANADEFGYCLSGQALVNLYGNGDDKASFLIEPGDVYLIPSGALHDIENTSSGITEIIAAFSSNDVEDFNLSKTIAMFSNAVLGNTWNVNADLFQSYNRSPEEAFAVLLNESPLISENARYKSVFKYSLEAAEPFLQNDGGAVRVAKGNVWPILKNQALYSLILTGQGMREPHWHPETSELGYVKKGRGRMSILSPSGDVDTCVMEQGDIYFIPKAYPHHIENLESANDLELLIFFDQAMPQDIGFTGSVLTYSPDVLSAITGLEKGVINQLHKRYADAFIVNKVNPIDTCQG